MKCLNCVFKVKKIIYIGLAVPAAISMFSWPFILNVQVRCQSQYGACKPEVGRDMEAFSGKSLVAAKSGAIGVLKKNYLVSDYSLQFKFPNVLLVQVLVKKPAYALYNRDLLLAALVDDNGKVLSVSSETTLPKVSTSQDLPKPGENVSQESLVALKLMRGILEMYQVSTGEIQAGSLTVDLPGPIRVLFPQEGDPEVLLGALKLIYTKTQGEYSGRFSQIDLRYKNPVLR